MSTPTPPVDQSDDDIFNSLVEVIEDGVVKMLSWGDPETSDDDDYDEDDDDDDNRITHEQPSKRFKSFLEDKENREPLPTPRFQLFHAKMHLHKYVDRSQFSLYGNIKVYCPYNNVQDVLWLPPNDHTLAKPDYDVSTLFSCDSHQPVRMLNDYIMRYVTHPSIPVYTFIYLILNLYAKNCDDGKDFFQLCNDPRDYKLPVPKYDTFCREKIKVCDGSLILIYIVITDPVDASLDVTFKTHPDYDVSGILFSLKLYAYYGDDYGHLGDSNYKGFYYMLPIFSADLVTLSDNYKITLNTSSLAVPAKGTLMIRAIIFDMFKGVPYVEGCSTFIPKHKGSTSGCIQGVRASLEVNVNWKYELAAGDQAEIQNDEEEHVNMQTKTEDPPKITEADHPQSHQQQVSGQGGDVSEEGEMVSDVVIGPETGEGQFVEQLIMSHSVED